MKLLLCILPFLLCAFSFRNVGFIGGLSRPAAGGSPFTGLIAQRFEGTGYDNGETWTEGGGAAQVDEDGTGLMSGAQQVNITTIVNQAFTTSPIFTADNELWGYCQFRFSTLPPGQRTVCKFVNEGGSTSLLVSLNASGTLTLDHGSATVNTVGTLSSVTTYHLWFYYKAGTGANGLASVGFSATGTEPTSGDNFASITTGTRTDNIDRVRIGIESNSTLDYNFDNVFVHATATVGNSPQ